mgnify:CR=1 FL=1
MTRHVQKKMVTCSMDGIVKKFVFESKFCYSGPLPLKKILSINQIMIKSSSLKQTLPQNNCDRMSGIPLSLADRLFEYRCQLDLANEVIKLLEQQRSLYRSHFKQCKCHLNNSDQQQQTEWQMDSLRQIDDQLETLYRKRYDPQTASSCFVSDSSMKYSMVDLTNSWLDKTKSRMLGIDMKTCM